MWRRFGQGKEWKSSWTRNGKERIIYAVVCGPTTSGLCPIPKVSRAKMLCDLIEKAGEAGLGSQTSKSKVDECSMNLKRGLIFRLTPGQDVIDSPSDEKVPDLEDVS